MININQCPECGSEDLFWSHTSIVASNGVVDGRLKSNEVESLFIQGCEFCSETVQTLTADEIVEILK